MAGEKGGQIDWGKSGVWGGRGGGGGFQQIKNRNGGGEGKNKYL